MAEFVYDSGVTNPREITSAIAKACDVTFQAVDKWKEGRTKSVTMPPINSFCDKYGASPDYISTGRLPKYRSQTYSQELEEVLQRFPEASAERRRIVLDLLRRDSAEDT